MKKLTLLMILSLSMIAANSYADFDADLVAVYSFNGNADDESGNERHGAIHGATITTGKDGDMNSAFRLDGKNDFIELNIESIQQVASISMWVKSDLLPSEGSDWHHLAVTKTATAGSNGETDPVVVQI